ncbi:hypothetical protein B0I00_3015 [Novosphingobium kunmingense]|uniref:Uncharacterized protein n=1 Tax=Novosphingobium kunmingense TaxID=1211806 RepID=A0A2N0H3S8_9SPHN|nr:hypothetical protein B0I00_3015 [Novosphingobium kunmingense]
MPLLPAGGLWIGSAAGNDGARSVGAGSGVDRLAGCRIDRGRAGVGIAGCAAGRGGRTPARPGPRGATLEIGLGAGAATRAFGGGARRAADRAIGRPRCRSGRGTGRSVRSPEPASSSPRGSSVCACRCLVTARSSAFRPDCGSGGSIRSANTHRTLPRFGNACAGECRSCGEGDNQMRTLGHETYSLVDNFLCRPCRPKVLRGDVANERKCVKVCRGRAGVALCHEIASGAHPA